MKLLLCSQAPTENFRAQFERFFGIPVRGTTVAYVPNARDLNNPLERVAATASRIKIQLLGFNVEEVDLLKTRGLSLNAKLQKKQVIWMHGGMAVNLIRAVDTSGLRELLPGLLQQGLCYVGSSAGSMIVSKTLDTAVWFVGEEEPEAKGLLGLGYVDFDIYPHYRDELKEKLQPFLDPNKQYYFLKDGEAIAYDNGKIERYES